MAPFNDRHSTHLQTDDTPTAGSTNLVTSGALKAALDLKTSYYYFRAGLSSNKAGNAILNQDHDMDNWTPTLESPYDGNNADLTSTTEWTCPVDGLYAVNCRLNMYNGNDFLQAATIKLWKQPVGDVYATQAEAVFVAALADATDIVTFQPMFYDIVAMEQGDRFKITYNWNSSGGGLTIFAGNASIWTITKVA